MSTGEPVTPSHSGDKTVPSARLSPRALSALGVKRGHNADAADHVDEAAGSDDDGFEVEDELPPLEHATGDTGETGNTSRTMFVGAAVEEARRRSGEPLEGDHEDLPRAPRWLTRGAPALLLLIMIVVSALKLLDLETRAPPPIQAQEAEKATPEVEVVEGGPPESRLAKELPPRGFALDDLLALELEAIRPDGSARFVRVRDVVRRRRVTLINMWATFCEPCKKELPDLKAMFEGASWGERVHFVPLLSQDSVDAETAHRTVAPQMPATEDFLAELDASGAAVEALRHDIEAVMAGDGGKPRPGQEIAAALGEVKSLPITLLLDCRREVRLAHVGGLGPKDFEELRLKLDALDAELDTSFCPPVEDHSHNKAERKQTDDDPEPAATTAEVATSAPPLLRPRGRCGDGRCNVGETCHSCPDDCGCTGANKCQKRSDGSYKCVLDADGLK